MASFNRVILMGNLTRDPEIRYIPSGTAVSEIGLAVNDRRKNAAGEWVDETTFVDVTFWGRTAEIAGEYLSKGSPVLIEGRLKLDSWESNDGQKRSKLRVVCENMRMLGGRGAGSGGGSGGGGGGGENGPRGPARRENSRGPAPPRSDDEFGPPPSEGGGGDDIPF